MGTSKTSWEKILEELATWELLDERDDELPSNVNGTGRGSDESAERGRSAPPSAGVAERRRRA